MERESDIDASQYPSVGLAYEFIKSSYEVMETRFEAANSRIQNLLTWAIGITSVISILAKVIIGESNFKSPWLLPVLLAFLALIIVGIFAQRTGGIKRIHPKKLYEDYLKYPEWEYKKWLVYWAGEHFNTNQKFINTKNYYIDIMTILLGLEIVFAFIWVIMT